MGNWSSLRLSEPALGTVTWSCFVFLSNRGNLCLGVANVKLHGPIMTDGKWHHVAGVYNGTAMSVYVDGVMDTSEKSWGMVLKNDYHVFIGANEEKSDEAHRCWNGLIDDVRI